MCSVLDVLVFGVCLSVSSFACLFDCCLVVCCALFVVCCSLLVVGCRLLVVLLLDVG